MGRAAVIAPEDITDAALVDAVSEALQLQQKAAPHRKPWRMRAADALDVDPRTFDRWLYGEGSEPPTATNLFRLFIYFGPGFANQVLGVVGYIAAPEDDPGHVPVWLARRKARGAVTKLEGAVKTLKAALGEVDAGGVVA